MRLAFGVAGGAFLLMVVGSMVVETLLPLWREGAYAELALNCLGLPLLLAGTLAFVWGGWRFLAGTGSVTGGDVAFGERRLRLRDPETPTAEKRRLESEQLGALWRAWKPGLAWLAAGFGLISLGSLIINGLPDALGLP